MAKTKISEFSTTAGNNTDINSINIAEGCAPSGINDAIRELMRQLKEFQTGGAGDSVNSGGDFSVATNKFTVASASGNTAVAGTLAVTGTTTLTGALVANGNATLGDGSGDTVTVKGTPTLEVNPTLSGGTANGVLYLNGSKVATSGSALTFDGTNFRLNGGTLAASGYTVQTITAGAGGSILQLGDGTIDLRAQINAGGGVGFFGTYTNTTPLAFTIGGSEAMRVTSTGLGIGTSSPGYKLGISGVATTYAASASIALYDTISGVAASRNWLIGNVAAGNYGELNFAVSSAAGGVPTNSKMTLDSSGNLGLGLAPSAWYSTGYSALQVKGSSLYSTSGNDTNLISNAYLSTTPAWTYISTAAASRYEQVSGQHLWHIAPSGTAGNAITFTQAMTLDASGNLGVGTTSPSQKLNVNGIALFEGSAQGNVIIQKTGTNGFSLFSSAAGTLGFYDQNAGAERARIDSSGNLLVGTTASAYASDERISVVPASTKNGLGIAVSGTGAKGIGIYNANSSGATSGTMLEFQNASSSVVGSITSTGSATSYNITSDQRLKENIADADSASALIDSLQVRKFDWKAGDHQRYGFVAQELVTVAPEAVHQPADPEEMMAVDYSKLVPMLVKEIQSLRARVAQLESN